MIVWGKRFPTDYIYQIVLPQIMATSSSKVLGRKKANDLETTKA